MEISGISANDPIYGSNVDDSGIGKDAFMDLLVTQMKNQNPLEPAKNEDMLAQLAQFSSLEQMQEVNENLIGLAVLQQSNALMEQLTNSSGLIDKSVQYIDPSTGESMWGQVSSVKIENGLAVLNIGGKDVPLAGILEVGPAPAPEA